MKDAINLKAIKVYPIVKKEYDILVNEIIKISKELKEIESIRKERKAYLINLKRERDEALKFIKRKNRKLSQTNYVKELIALARKKSGMK